MHKTILAAAIGLALAGSAVGATIDKDTTTSWTEQSGSVAYGEDVTGTGAVDLTVSGAWSQAFGGKCAKFCVCQVLEGGGRNLSPLFYDVG